ncbi:hypothetical protein [Liquorilactobacillus nagelii]|uniref:hypothetical protein n=1 Tax=Liquorilactobacillus nagelii TaxID=82688 RepID=UPI00070C433E|nr:hypothetical protein [Liquorilactobacillus nagelii]QYH53429.1 hypothetical protein G6O73_01445 [Liquorilactobacillus nagelii DSM 13675]
MHKRARNHKTKVAYEELRKEWLKAGDVWALPIVEDYKGGSESYEPQGKREARKNVVIGLFYYKSSNFNELHF